MNKPIHEFLSGKRSTMTLNGRETDLNTRYLAPSPRAATITQNYMGHLPSREELLGDIPARNYNQIRTVNL